VANRINPGAIAKTFFPGASAFRIRTLKGVQVVKLFSGAKLGFTLKQINEPLEGPHTHAGVMDLVHYKLGQYKILFLPFHAAGYGTQ
jgi:hypothetical protein